MLEIVAKVKHWLNPPSIEKIGPVLFAVPCQCGQVVEGQRQPAHQLVLCPRCGERVFVFPQSQFPPVPVPAGQGSSKPAQALATSSRRWKALLALGLAVLAMGGLVVVLILTNQTPEDDSTSLPPREMAKSWEKARVEMGQGKFHTALEHLKDVRHSQEYEGLPAPRKRELEQLRRQAALLADLQEVRLADILRHANDIPQREWDKVFAHRYRSKAVLFDAQLRTDAVGKPHLDVHLLVAGQEARVEVGDLELLGHLTLDQPVRVIFGARLAGIGREPSGALVARLDPKSGVLLTDEPALGAAAPPLRNDPELSQVLKRQQDWWARLP